MSFETEELSRIELEDKIVGEIAKKTGKSYQEIFSMISEKQERMGNLLSFEIVALIVAKEVGVKISEYISLVEKRILNEDSR
ncbi:MAG: DUF2240 family protein [Archaeoglobaceae archaeon]|nr:DUF2240 family protein [Archaeoglobaceae archaeon]MDW7989939.1 DUF2240 family protein [Archaeoglobaceae archaeon]